MVPAMRVVLDSNVLVAGTRSRTGTSRLWLRSVLAGDITLLISVPLVLQYEAVLTRREHLDAAGATVEQIRFLLDSLCSIAEAVEVSFLWRPTLPDADDEMVLETAINGHADWLITFNQRDFANVGPFRFQIASPAHAWRAYAR
jgi:putative PIN family toxin of toxin-antitoxin system